MSGLFLLPLLGAALTYAVLAHRRLRAARRAEDEARRLAEARARSLGLLALELRPAGLALQSRAETLAAPHGAAIAAKAQHLLRLSDEVSEYLAAEAGPRRLDLAIVPLAPLLEEAVADAAAQLVPGIRQWRLAPDFTRLTLRADRRALRGALLQVLSRAARTTREGDWIDLRPVLTPDSIAIVVEDEGAGLPAEDLAPGAVLATEGTRGLGFGLFAARSLLEAHGGALQLEALPGVGARAWLCLPRERLVEA